MLLMIDNYDSFTYNVVQYLLELGADVKVVRNNEITIDEIRAMNPDHIVISPGPCNPDKAGVSMAAIEAFPVKSRCWVSVWVTRALVRYMAGRSSAPDR